MSKTISVSNTTYSILKAAKDGVKRETNITVSYEKIINCMIQEMRK